MLRTANQHQSEWETIKTQAEVFCLFVNNTGLETGDDMRDSDVLRMVALG